jgi:hypothetical protein
VHLEIVPRIANNLSRRQAFLKACTTSPALALAFLAIAAEKVTSFGRKTKAPSFRNKSKIGA